MPHHLQVSAPPRSRLTLLLALAGPALGLAPGCEAPGSTLPRSPRTGEMSVRPGINAELKQGNIELWVERFEGESREVYQGRHRIVEMVGAGPGMRIADVGAGTGFFAEMFAERVGPQGRVYAVEIIPEFLEHIRTRAASQGLDNLVTVLCTEDSVELPPRSIDLAFICDTYHHFEYPKSTLATLHEALAPGGEVIVVDFKRIPGVSREWVVNHVRGGQDEVIEEMASAGFEVVSRGDDLDFLNENYVMRLRRR